MLCGAAAGRGSLGRLGPAHGPRGAGGAVHPPQPGGLRGYPIWSMGVAHGQWGSPWWGIFGYPSCRIALHIGVHFSLKSRVCLLINIYRLVHSNLELGSRRCRTVPTTTVPGQSWSTSVRAAQCTGCFCWEPSAFAAPSMRWWWRHGANLKNKTS